MVQIELEIEQIKENQEKMNKEIKIIDLHIRLLGYAIFIPSLFLLIYGLILGFI